MDGSAVVDAVVVDERRTDDGLVVVEQAVVDVVVEAL